MNVVIVVKGLLQSENIIHVYHLEINFKISCYSLKESTYLWRQMTLSNIRSTGL